MATPSSRIPRPNDAAKRQVTSIMQEWQQQMQAGCSRPDELARRFGINAEALQKVARRYPLRLTGHILSLIEGPNDPLWKQFVPDLLELGDDPALSADPLAEEEHSPLPGIVHRHSDRVLLLAAGSCPALCRFCFRKGRTSLSADDDFSAAVAYVADHPEIREVILTGGEPLLLEDGPLTELLTALRAIEHVDLLRIHTRAPVVLPSRITDELADLLGSFSPLYLMLHINHPRELTVETAAACARLADAGIPLGSQTVLLKSVNDEAALLEELFRSLLRLRVRPYYLHHLDLIRGCGHFRVPIEKGLKLLGQLRQRLTGLGLPQYVVDLPGGRGKVPIVPEVIERLGETALLRAPDGSLVELPNR